MKQEDPRPNLTEAEISDQERKIATDNFIHSENKPKTPQKSWLRRNLGKILTIGGLVAVVGAGAGIGIENAIKKSSVPTPVPEIFDPSALKSIIGPNDSTQMTFDEYVNIAPEIWDGQNEVMTSPVPIWFKNNRTPILNVEKIASPFDGKLNQISIEGVEQGDIIISPVDATLSMEKEDEANPTVFFLNYTDPQGNNIGIEYNVSSLKPLIDYTDASPGSIAEEIKIPIKKNQPIGEIIASDKDPYVMLIGTGPLLKEFNLAVTPEDKVIILTK